MVHVDIKRWGSEVALVLNEQSGPFASVDAVLEQVAADFQPDLVNAASGCARPPS